MVKSVKLNNILFWMPLLLLCIYNLYLSTYFRVHDFANYYFGAKAIIVNNFDLKIYNSLIFNEFIRSYFDGKVFASYYPNTPSLSILYVPFAFLKIGVAKLIFNIISIIVFFITIYDLKKSYKFQNYYLFLIPILFYNAIKNNILYGQCYFILLALICFGLKAMDKDKISIHHFMWPIGVILKSSPLILFGFIFFSRKLGSLIIQLAILSGLVVATILITNFEVCQYYLSNVFFKASGGNIYNGFTIKAKSFEMLFKHLFYFEPLLNPSPFYDSITCYLFSKILLKLFLLFTAIFFTLKSQSSNIQKLGLWILVLLLMSPNMSSYSLIFLLIPYLVILSKNNKRGIGLSSIVILLINFYPYHLFYKQEILLLNFGAAILLLLFLIGYLFNFRKDILKGNSLFQFCASICLCVFISVVIVFVFGKKNDLQNNYVLNEETDIMMVDFLIENNVLSVFYKTNNKPKEKKFPLKYQVWEVNQEFVLKTDLFENINPENIYKSILINDSLIYYMTDVNRSPGFYTLKKIDLSEAK